MKMKMKKVVGVLAALMAVFSFTVIAGAQDNLGTVTCTSCTKCALQNVPCPQTLVGIQGAVTITEACPFDYDDAYGYCPSTLGNTEFDAAGNGIAARKCRLVFNVCDCPDACNLNVGTKIGIQMTIMTTGVYWAEDEEAYDANGNRTIWFNNYSSPVANACAPARDAEMLKNFGTVTYYAGITESLNAKGKLDRKVTGAGVPAAGCLAGNVPAANRMTVIESNVATDYVVKAEDATKCMFWIDVPAMRLDGAAKAGDAIKVRTTLLWNRTVAGLCPSCDPPILCECVITVGVVCCETKDANTGCMFFPYVLQGLQEDSGWVSGVAISALADTLPTDAWCKLTLKDQKGNVATWTNTNMGNGLVWSFVLDSIMDNFGKTLEPGATSLKVESNYRMDGYTFMNANFGFGTGAMPRACGEGCNP
jgi:hypothetical protein